MPLEIRLLCRGGWVPACAGKTIDSYAVAVAVAFLGLFLTFLVTLPALMQEVQTLIFFGRPFINARTGWRLGYQRREVLLLA